MRYRNHHDAIEDFLAQKRIALVGLSSHGEDFSRYVCNAMRERGYEIVPVNPHAEIIGEMTCYPSLGEVPAPVDGVLVMTPASASAEVVRQAADAGITRVWLHRGGGPGAVSLEAVALGKELGLLVIAGECPMMFLKNVGWFHGVHAFGKKLVGRYPVSGAT